MNAMRVVLSHTVSLLVLCASVADVRAQAAPWGPVLREVRASVANRLVFRGYDVGSPGYEAAVVVPIYGHTVVESYRPTRFGFTLGGALAAAGTERAGAVTASRATGSATASWLLAGSETAVQLIGSAYTAVGDGSNGAEAGIAVRRVRVPIFGEPDLIMDAEVLRNFGELDGFYGVLALGFELTPPVLEQRLTLVLGTRLHGDDYAATDGGRAVEAGAGARFVAVMLGNRTIEIAIDGGLLAADGRRAAGVARVGVALR